MDTPTTNHTPITTPTPLAGTSDAEALADLIRSTKQKQGQQKPEPDPQKVREFSRRTKREFAPLSPEEEQRRQDAELQRRIRREQMRRSDAYRTFILQRGKRYAGCKLKTFDAKGPEQRAALERVRQFAMNLPSERNVLLYGPKGTGKDHLLVALARIAILRHGQSVQWWNGADLFGEVRDRMERREPEKRFIETNAKPDVLIISDPAITGNLSNHQATILNRIVDARYSDCKPTWISTNVNNLEQLEAALTATVADRLRDDALAIWCNWSSYRQTRKG